MELDDVIDIADAGCASPDECDQEWHEHERYGQTPGGLAREWLEPTPDQQEWN